MRYKGFWAITAMLLFVLTSLTACQSGPAAECDDCAEAEASASTPFGEAAASAAKGGQDASNQPTQTDPGGRQIHTPISRGSGSQSVNTQTDETRSQAGAPSVNQGLVLPTQADARTGGGVSPVVASLQSYVDDLRTQLKLAIMSSNPEQEQRLMDAIDRAIGQMAQAQASAGGTVNHTYNFDGARIVQSVANGSNSGDGTTAIDPKAAEAVGKPLEAAARSVMEASTEKPAAATGEALTPSGGLPDVAFPPPAIPESPSNGG